MKKARDPSFAFFLFHQSFIFPSQFFILFCKLKIIKKEVHKLYPKEYVLYLVHFQGSRDYFECHEIFEEYWKQTDPNKQSILVAFILLAVSCYHHRRGNFSGAKKSLYKSQKLFQLHHDKLIQFGLDSKKMEALLTDKLNSITQKKPYKSFQLPIIDHQLIDECKKVCNQFQYTWLKESDLKNDALIHKHIKRDRRHVVEERKEAILRKKRRE